MHRDLIIGIDTSNYTTSMAVCTADGNIASDRRRLLSVKEGNRGLRQQEALFQHINNLPEIYSQVINDIEDVSEVKAVCVSSRPRPVEGSYMPCFNAGITIAEVIGKTLGIPLFVTSHQEGHLAAASKDLDIEDFVFCHLSGGTCELIDSGDMKIIGGSLDISFGQLLDRTGVANGLQFPCGRELDEIAMRTDKSSAVLSKIKCSKGYFNLSGIETQVSRCNLTDDTVCELFDRICECLGNALKQTGKSSALLAGGVSSSGYLRQHIQKYAKDIRIYFGEPDLCKDNAVGTALIGGELWLQSL